MSSAFELILLLFASYLTGSTPTSIIISKITKGIDIREHGSGNAGATNVFRVLGLEMGTDCCCG
jgi:glycerol-3-phosphate acyltransferase PlsY